MARCLRVIRKMTTKPHDALFEAGFADPHHAAAIFRALLPTDVSAAIAWSTMLREPGSFIDPELADRHTDLLFSVELRHGRGRAYLYLLLEHQSTSDADMPLRLLTYQVRIWEQSRKEHPNARLPLILPIVISHVPGGWAGPRRFAEMFDPDPTSMPGLADLVPGFTLVIEDLAHLSNEELKARALDAFPALVLWALRDARDRERLLENLSYWATMFDEAMRAPRGIEAVSQLMRYIALVTKDLPVDTFRAKIRALDPATEEIAMTTMAEELHQRGLSQGLEQGRAEGRAEGLKVALRQVLSLRFGALAGEYEARIEAATSESLERYLQRGLTSVEIAHVFGD